MSYLELKKTEEFIQEIEEEYKENISGHLKIRKQLIKDCKLLDKYKHKKPTHLKYYQGAVGRRASHTIYSIKYYPIELRPKTTTLL